MMRRGTQAAFCDVGVDEALQDRRDDIATELIMTIEHFAKYG